MKLHIRGQPIRGEDEGYSTGTLVVCLPIQTRIHAHQAQRADNDIATFAIYPSRWFDGANTLNYRVSEQREGNGPLKNVGDAIEERWLCMFRVRHWGVGSRRYAPGMRHQDHA